MIRAPSLDNSGWSLELDPRLFLNTLESTHRYVAVRVRHGYPSPFCWVFELLVAPNLIYLIPAVQLQQLYDVPAVHAFSHPNDTHFIHTRQEPKSYGVRPAFFLA